MRSNRRHLGSRHLPREPGRVRYSVVKGKAAGRSTPGYPAASMIGGMSVVMDLKDVEKEVVSDPLTIDFMWAVGALHQRELSAQRHLSLQREWQHRNTMLRMQKEMVEMQQTMLKMQEMLKMKSKAKNHWPERAV